MKKIIKKLNSHAGETITEVLVALLISTFALLMLAMMIRSAQNSVDRSRVALEKYYSEDATPVDSTVSVVFEDSGKTFTVTYTSGTAKINSKTLGGKTVLSYQNINLNKGAATP